VTWRVGRQLSVVMEYDRSRRESDLRSTEYIDNRAWVKFRFGRGAPLPTGTTVPDLPALPSQSGY
jgi:hypothetical protein